MIPCSRFVIKLFLGLLIPGSVFAQPGFPQNLFRSPVDFEISLSGSYGEIRPNHLHSGIDIRTDGLAGKPVYASADGYISRIFVSPWGFGKALYISHTAGYTTVYGHLDRFRGAVAEYARAQQYQKESFSIDVTVPSGTLRVRKGDIIGYSGNSGSSGGPHLHFEIRDAKSQEPLDPLSLGIQVRDNLPPQIWWLKIYPFSVSAMVNFAGRPVTFQATGNNGSYRLVSADTIWVSGDVIFGIETYDYHNSSTIRCGIKSIELLVDGGKVFGQCIDRYSFGDTRCVNAILDYPQNRSNRQRYFRSYVAPGNRLEIFDGVVNRGVVNFGDRERHRIQYIVKDVHGNTSRLTFWVRSHPPPEGGARPVEKETAAKLFLWNRKNSFRNEYVEFDMPSGALYEDLEFSFRTTPAVRGSYARVHHLHDEDVPVDLFCNLSVRAETLPPGLESKALLVKVGENGKFTSQGGEYENGYVKGRIREFGSYTIAADTIPPKIRPLNIHPGKNIGKQNTISLAVSDDLSGISTCRGSLDGNWILMDYDPKSDRLVYTFDERIKPGKNLFRLVVTDGVGNRTEYQAPLIR